MKLTKTHIILTLLFTVIFISNRDVLTKEVYKWTDENGTLHITDRKSNIPTDITKDFEELNWKQVNIDESEEHQTIGSSFEFIEDDKYIDGTIDTEYEKELRKKWRARAIEIEDDEYDIKYKLRRAHEDYNYKKKEVDYMLINGYKADYTIMELRNLEKYIEELEAQIAEIEPKMQNLRIEARKAGIPEGYLRP